MIYKRGKMKSKKGAEMTVGTIIIIVLALIVLVVLVVGFTGGWTNLWSRVTSFFGGGSNVDSIVQACQVACTTESTYDYCTRERTLKADKETKLAIDGGIDYPDRDKKNVVEGTCKAFGASDTYKAMGFDSCVDLCPSGGNGNGEDLAAKCREISDPSKCIDDCRTDDTGTCVPA